MFGPGLQQRARRIAESIVRPLAALGLTPNMATLLGLVLNVVTALLIARGSLVLGGAMLVFAGVFDMFDGALARVRDQKTTFGAFFDSTLDRFSEGIVLLGIIVYALTQRGVANPIWIVCLAYIAGLGSLMVSYTRARAEGLGLEAKNGLMARPERVALLAAGLILGSLLQPPGTGLLWTLALLAVSSVFTSVQRIVAVYRTLTRGEAAAAPTPEPGADGQPQGAQQPSATLAGSPGAATRAERGARRARRMRTTVDGVAPSFFSWRRARTPDEPLTPGRRTRR
jgi:CDP-diacylglycerol--glycerol-3-phosphate 3-phosphatidyltransferase